MKRLLNSVFLILIAACGIAQMNEVRFTALYGFSANDHFMEEWKLAESIKNEYRFYNFFNALFYSGPGVELPDVKMTSRIQNPIGARVEIRSGLIGFGVESMFRTIQIQAKFTEPSSEELVFVNYEKRLGSVVPFFSLHPLHKKHSPKKMDLYINWGLGYRWGYKRMEVVTKDSIDKYEADVFPILVRACVGFAYYPIESVGIVTEAGIGISNLSVGVVLRAM